MSLYILLHDTLHTEASVKNIYHTLPFNNASFSLMEDKFINLLEIYLFWIKMFKIRCIQIK